MAALAWARREVERQPTASVGIVVPDLAGRLAAVRACAGEIVGVPADGGVSSPAWNVSLGAPIGATSLAGTAVDLIFLAWTHLPAGRAAALLRSASLAGADHEARWRRAGIERRWLDDGVGRVSLGDAIAAVEQIGDRLAQRLASLRPVVAKIRRAARREWVDAWREVLRIAGWPGDHPLSSDEHQVSEAFEGVLVAFAALDSVAAAAGAISAEQALASIAELCAATPFQPESPSAPIQILGLLEAIGLPFDTLWITGMSSAAWPRPVRPHPLLPIVWQRERGVPRSDPAGELAWAAAVTAGFERAAPVVIASHARNTDDGPLTGSSLFAHAEAFAPEVPATPAQAIFAARPARERLVERRVPAPAPGERHRRGSGLIEAQSACPFQAVAAMRWRADPWPSPVVGLTALERGTLVHETLAAFWRSTRDQAGLNALVADASRYSVAREDAARVAIGKLAPARWLGVPPAVRRIERRRLIRALDGWLRSVEVARPPFRVALVEHEERLALGALELDLRLDRLDELEDGGVAIVDYKTGRSGSPAKWTTDRPEATQLALYTLARRASHPDAPVRAAVLGQIRPGEWKAVGVYADRQARWAGDRGRAERIVDWPAHEARWDALVRGLAGEFLEGHAGVAPRDANACRTCARQSLCRVGELVAPGDEDDL